MELGELIEIMAALRSDKGCPWDREQTKESLKPFMIEEAYEVLDAIDGGNPEELKEELGDLLFQIVFHCRLAGEKGDFTMQDVIDTIGKKMIARHPHVFAGKKFETTAEVVAHWEVQKKKEGKMKDSVIEGIPKHMPSLLRARKVQSRASRVGFDWEDPKDVLAKLEEEIREFGDALSEGNKEKIEDELGDILFSLVNVSRFVKVNPEEALRKTISKFISRFRHIEMSAAEEGRKLSDMSLAEMDVLWEEAKAMERRPG